LAAPTAIGIAGYPSSILANEVFTVHGNLYDTTLPFPQPWPNVSGKTLHVSYDGVVVGDVVTDAAGYSLQMSIPTAGVYRVRVGFDGDVDYLTSSHLSPEFTVTARAPTAPTEKIVFERAIIQRLYDAAVKYGRTRFAEFLKNMCKWHIE